MKRILAMTVLSFVPLLVSDVKVLLTTKEEGTRLYGKGWFMLFA